MPGTPAETIQITEHLKGEPGAHEKYWENVADVGRKATKSASERSDVDEPVFTD